MTKMLKQWLARLLCRHSWRRSLFQDLGGASGPAYYCTKCGRWDFREGDLTPAKMVKSE
jgi:hypothetical protein